jgi:periplasmic protein TonB
MSYVSEQKRARPLGMGAAIFVNGSIILAVALSPLIVAPPKARDPFEGRSVKLLPPPKPKDEIKQDAKKLLPIFAPKTITKTVTDDQQRFEMTNEKQATDALAQGGGDDDANSVIRERPKPPIPIFNAATRDSRFARSFQPDYPVGMLRQEIEGSVTVRVLVGTDGRVRQVQILSATESDFARATEKQALKAWRFKPATRDGIPVEDWQTLTVRFDIS